jgi:hypothetical protein
VIGFAVFLASAAMPVLGGMYADEMAKCLVKSTNAADRSVLVRWLFAAGASHPAVAGSMAEVDNYLDKKKLEGLVDAPKK